MLNGCLGWPVSSPIIKAIGISSNSIVPGNEERESGLTYHLFPLVRFINLSHQVSFLYPITFYSHITPCRPTCTGLFSCVNNEKEIILTNTYRLDLEFLSIVWYLVARGPANACIVRIILYSFFHKWKCHYQSVVYPWFWECWCHGE